MTCVPSDALIKLIRNDESPSSAFFYLFMLAFFSFLFMFCIFFFQFQVLLKEPPSSNKFIIFFLVHLPFTTLVRGEVSPLVSNLGEVLFFVLFRIKHSVLLWLVWKMTWLECSFFCWVLISQSFPNVVPPEASLIHYVQVKWFFGSFGDTQLQFSSRWVCVCVFATAAH